MGVSNEEVVDMLRPWLDEAEALLGDRDALFGLALAESALKAEYPSKATARHALRLWLDHPARRGRTYAEEQERGYTRGLRGVALEQVALLYVEARRAAREALEALT